MIKEPTRLTYKEIIAGFSVKVLLGFLYGYVYLHYYNGDDTWKLFHASVSETKLLLTDPATFFRNEYTPLHSIEIGDGWKEIVSLYLNDLQYALFVKTMAFVNLVTRGNYYLNVVVFNAFVFFGHYWFFKLMTEFYPEKRNWFFGVIFFFLPAVFWLSGLRIDGMLFFFLALYLLHLLSKRKHGLLRSVMLVTGFAGVFLCRPEFGLFLLVSTIAYLFAKYLKRSPWLIFGAVYTVALFLFFASKWVFGGNGFPGIVADLQHRFLQLKGTQYQVAVLQPDLFDFLLALPSAVMNTFLRPFPWDAKGALQWMAAGETFLFLSILVYTVINLDKKWKQRIAEPMILLLLFLCLSVYISLGYVVPFPGAIIRYKAIAELVLIAICGTLTKKNFCYIKQNNNID